MSKIADRTAMPQRGRPTNRQIAEKAEPLAADDLPPVPAPPPTTDAQTEDAGVRPPVPPGLLVAGASPGGDAADPMTEANQGLERNVKITPRMMALVLEASEGLHGQASDGSLDAARLSDGRVVLSIPTPHAGSKRECIEVPAFFVVKSFRAK